MFTYVLYFFSFTVHLAMDFLKQDCENVNKFFRLNGVATMNISELFSFITHPNLRDNHVDDYLMKINDNVRERPMHLSVKDEIDEAVFKFTHVPRRLDEI